MSEGESRAAQASRFANPARCADAAVETLGALAGPGLRLVNMSLDMGGPPSSSEADVEITTHVDKRSRSIAFLRLLATSDGRLVFQARAVFAAAPT